MDEKMTKSDRERKRERERERESEREREREEERGRERERMELKKTCLRWKILLNICALQIFFHFRP